MTGGTLIGEGVPATWESGLVSIECEGGRVRGGNKEARVAWSTADERESSCKAKVRALWPFCPSGELE